MDTRPIKASSASLIALVVSLLLAVSFSTRATAAFAQTPTTSNTPENATLPPTQTPTMTPSPSPSPTPTPTQTPTSTATPYPSATDIQKAFNDLKDIKSQLQSGDSWLHWPSISNNLISNAIWVVIALLGGLVSGKGILALIVRRGNTQNETLVQLAKTVDSILNVVIGTFVAVFLVLLLLYFSSLGRVTSQISSQSDLTVVIGKLDRIESELQNLSGSIPGTPSGTPAPTPTPQVSNQVPNTNANLYTIIVGALLILSVVVNAVQFFVYGRRRVEPDSVDTQTMTERPLESLNKDLFAAILLVLILMLLPYPVDNLLLPFVLGYFMLAFFNVVRLYPNQGLKRIVVDHYSLIILLVVFGAWLNFWDAVERIVRPIREVIVAANSQYWYENKLYWLLSSQFASLAVLVISFLLAILFWRSLKKQSEKEAIPKLKASMKTARNDIKKT